MITDITKHLTDQEFFTHIKFFNLIFENGEIQDSYDGKEETFRLWDIRLGSEEMGYIFNRIFLSGQLSEISVNISRVGYDSKKKLTEAREEAEKKPSKEKENLLKIIKNIEAGKKIKIDDVSSLSWVWYEIYEAMSFTPKEYKIPDEIKAVFQAEINKYLDNFINDRLTVVRKNYYKFEAQKRTLIKLIEDDKKIALYGNNFIVEVGIDDRGISKDIPDFCLIQTLYALQKLGYLKIIDIWQGSKYPKDSFDRERDDYNKEPRKYINANITLEPVFIQEINNNYKKENPKNILEKFDAKRGVIKFAGQEIELSKKGKETDAVLLLKTLLKAEADEWKHNDEILTDWGYTEADLEKVPKNKVYFAGQKVNTAVALKTKIDDFLECNTSKARINPKYRKVDE